VSGFSRTVHTIGAEDHTPPATAGSRLRAAARHAHREAWGPRLRRGCCSLATESASLRETPAAAGSV